MLLCYGEGRVLVREGGTLGVDLLGGLGLLLHFFIYIVNNSRQNGEMEGRIWEIKERD